MNLEEFQASIEFDKSWREDEIRFYNNIQSSFELEQRMLFRKSIICILYAHIEGFVHFSFSLYVESINGLNLKCKEVHCAIAAAALNEEFSAMKNPEKKNPLFSRTLPDDTKLHRMCREIEFIEKSLLVQEKSVRIPKKYINTESNIGPDVLKKLLYQVGLNFDDFEDIKNDLNKLLTARNNVAHGKHKEGVKDSDYDLYKRCFQHIFSKLSNVIVMAYANKKYLFQPHLT